MNGVCQEVVLFTSTDTMYDDLGIVVDGDAPTDRIIFAGGPTSQLFTIPKHAVTAPDSLKSLQGQPVSLAVDGGYLFMTWYGDSNMRRLTLQGTALVQDVATAPGMAFADTHVTARGGWVYWTAHVPAMPGGDPGASDAQYRLFAAPSGTGDADAIVVAGGDVLMSGVAADDAYVYWTEKPRTGTKISLKRAALSPPTFGPAETVDPGPDFTYNTPGPVVVRGGTVYWAALGGPMYLATTDLAQKGQLTNASVTDLVADDESIYWLDGDGSVHRISTAGAGATVVGTARGGRSITQDCGAIYWTGNDMGVSVRMLVK
jgi:hypothetical protein